MNQEPTAFTIVRTGFARMVDAAGLVLLAVLGWQVMFGYSSSFQARAWWIGVIGVAACWLDPHSVRNLPWAAVGWAAIAVVSAAVHQWDLVPHPPVAGWTMLVAPAWHLVVMVVFVYGVGHLLRTADRLSWFTVLLVGSICVIAVQLLFDRASTNFFYNRAGSTDLPSVAQWFGMHQIGLVLAVGLPLVLSISLVDRSPWRVLSGLVLGGGLAFVAFFNGSRSNIVAMAVTGVAMFVPLAVSGRKAGRLQRAVGITLCVLAVMLVATIFVRSGTSMVTATASTGNRTPIWMAATRIFLDYPWLGVGPGNYMLAMLDGGYARYLPWYPANTGGVEQAHNLPIQVAAETGALGLLCLLAFFWWMVRACWRAWIQGHVPMVAYGMLFAVAAFFFRNLSDNFLDLGISADRIRVFAWMLFAAALALERLPRYAFRASA